MSDQNAGDLELGAPESEFPPLGSVLRAAREARGLSLSEVAMALKLSVRQLEAIEQESFADLPGPAFVKGFVRNYGRHVGVNVEPMIAARWPTSPAASVDLKPMTNAGGTLPVSGERSHGRRLVFPLLLVLVLTGTLAWYFDGFDPYSGAEPAATLGEPSGATAIELPPLHEGPSDEAVLEAESLVPPQPAEPPVSVADVAQPLAAAPESLTAAPVEASPEPSVPPPAVADAAPDAVVSAPGRLVFRLDDESWLEVRDRSDRRLYSGLGTPGSVRVVQGQRPFAITIGNARAVKLEHAGREVDLKPHTSSGGVARLTLE